jgi:hypothetical protein
LPVSALLVYPLISTPLIADDFVNPFTQATSNGIGLRSSIRYGWNVGSNGPSFRPVGAIVGSVYTSLWLDISSRLDINLTVIFGLTKLVLYMTLSFLVAMLICEVAGAGERTLSQRRTYLIVIAALSITAQIHAHWSNDPVVNYPISGLLSACIATAVLLFAFKTARTLRPSHVFTTAAFGMVGVWHYELTIGAALAGSIVILLHSRPSRATIAVRFLRRLFYASCVVGLPALAVLAGRAKVGSVAETYGGTTLALSSRALSTTLIHIASATPGAGWKLSHETLGGSARLSLLAMFAAALAVTVFVTSFRALPPIRNAVAKISACFLIYFLVASIMLGITLKVQNETSRIGQVYLEYVPGHILWATALIFLGSLCIGAGKRTSEVFAVFLVIFATIQFTINWRLSESLNNMVVPNRQVIAAYSSSASESRRCMTLLNWRQGNWPEYYADTLTKGIAISYQNYFGESFCD